jgi:hypothetical protein
VPDGKGRSVRVDMRRIVAAAAQAALDNGEPQPRKRSGLGAVAAGAMLAVAARVAVRKAGLPHIGDLAEMPEQLRNRLAGSGRLRDEGEDLDDHEFDDEPEGEEETDDRELAAEADEGLDQEDRKGARARPDQEYWDHLEALEAAELRDRGNDSRA